MSKYWSDTVRSLTPYVPGEQPQDRKYIKLNTNENPYPPSPRSIEAIRGAADEGMRLYPDPDASRLKAAIAEHFNVDNADVFVGNGSDEVLALGFMAFFKNKGSISFPDITYSFYPVYCDLFEIPFNRIPLKDDFSLCLDEYPESSGGIVFPNPNAPTGLSVELESIDKLAAKHSDVTVIVDEAYIDFGGRSAVFLTEKYPNVLAVHTLSKSRSLAGLRVGFAIGHPDLIEGLERVKNSFNSYPLDRLAIAGAVAAIEDTAYFDETRKKVIQTREWTASELKQLGFSVVPSRANFIFARHFSVPARKLFGKLRESGILVRYFDKPRIDNHLRITIGTDPEMKAFVETLKEILQ